MAPSPYGSGGGADGAPSTGTSALVFMLVVAAGSAYIVAAKLGGIGQVYVTFVPVTIMIGYAVLIWSARGLRLRDDQAGDNLYYMGFLFTLTSLGVSLYQFNANRAAEEIVQNFGIAIGSTITGIALRVIFNQMRQDPIEVERTMRLELADAARRVRRELDSTVVEFGYVRRAAHQAAADSFAQVAVKVDEVVARLLAGMTEVATQSERPLDIASRHAADTMTAASTTMVEALAATSRQLGAEMERLSKSVVDIAAAITDVTTRLEAMRTPDSVIEVRLEPVVASVTGAVDRFTTRTEQQAAMIRDAVEAARGAVEGSTTSVGALREDVRFHSSASRAALKAAQDSSDAMTQILDQFNADAWEQVELLRALLERADDAFRIFTETVVRSSDAMTAQTQGFRDILRGVQTSAETLAMATERLADIAEDLQQVAPTREAIG